MNKLSKTDSDRAGRALAECIQKTANIEDTAVLHEVAGNILLESLGDKPELLKRACEAYNSEKAIAKLTSAGDDNRGDSFAILDIPALYKKACDRLSASAARKVDTGAFKPSIRRIFNEGAMPKAASAEPEAPEVEWGAFTMKYNPTPQQAYHDMVDSFQRSEQAVRKIAAATSNAKDNAIHAGAALRTALFNASDSLRKEAADLICNNYGEFGVDTIFEYNEKMPIRKIATDEIQAFAGTLRPEDNEVYRAMEVYKKASDRYTELQALSAGAVYDNIEAIKAFGGPEGINEVGTLLQGGVVKNASKIMNLMAFKAISDGLSETFGARDLDDNAQLRKIVTPAVTNNLRELELKNTLYDMYLDDYIASFPDDKIVDAVNASVKRLPARERERPYMNAPLIQSNVIANLTRGSDISSSDTTNILDTAKALEKQRDFGTSIDQLLSGGSSSGGVIA